MPTLELTTEQAIKLIEQLPHDRQAQVILKLAQGGAVRRFRERSEAIIREASRARGLDWDAMDDEQRQDFIEEWLDS